jgi:hypothetical protein
MPAPHDLLECQTIAVDAVRSIVCEWEQNSHDAELAGDKVHAQLYKQWAVAADLVQHRVHAVFTDEFSKAVDAYLAAEVPLKRHLEVVLPDLTAKATPVKAEVVV